MTDITAERLAAIRARAARHTRPNDQPPTGAPKDFADLCTLLDRDLVDLLDEIDRLRNHPTSLPEDLAAQYGDLADRFAAARQDAAAGAVRELLRMVLDLDAHRAVLASQAAERGALAERVKEAESECGQLRAMYDDLCGSMSRTGTRLATAERELEKHRQRAEQAEAAVQRVRSIIAYLGRRHDLEAILTTGDIGRLRDDLTAALDGTEGS